MVTELPSCSPNQRRCSCHAKVFAILKQQSVSCSRTQVKQKQDDFTDAHGEVADLKLQQLSRTKGTLHKCSSCTLVDVTVGICAHLLVCFYVYMLRV